MPVRPASPPCTPPCLSLHGLNISCLVQLERARTGRLAVGVTCEMPSPASTILPACWPPSPNIPVRYIYGFQPHPHLFASPLLLDLSGLWHLPTNTIHHPPSTTRNLLTTFLRRLCGPGSVIHYPLSTDQTSRWPTESASSANNHHLPGSPTTLATYIILLLEESHRCKSRPGHVCSSRTIFQPLLFRPHTEVTCPTSTNFYTICLEYKTLQSQTTRQILHRKKPH